MDYYQGVVSEYLRADRSIFLNPEFLLQLDEDEKMPKKGRSWYVDLLAADFRTSTVFLCEVTYSRTLVALLERLAGWSQHWPGVLAALHRDAHLPEDWKVRPWVFIPTQSISTFLNKYHLELPSFPATPLITPLEMTAPWEYCTYDRRGEKPKPDIVPSEMKS